MYLSSVPGLRPVRLRLGLSLACFAPQLPLELVCSHWEGIYNNYSLCKERRGKLMRERLDIVQYVLEESTILKHCLADFALLPV